MKSFLILSIFVSTFSFGQKVPKDTTVNLSSYEAAKAKQFDLVRKEAERITKEYYQFLSEFIIVNKINHAPGSPDSIQFVEPNRFRFILRQPKKPLK